MQFFTHNFLFLFLLLVNISVHGQELEWLKEIQVLDYFGGVTYINDMKLSNKGTPTVIGGYVNKANAYPAVVGNLISGFDELGNTIFQDTSNNKGGIPFISSVYDNDDNFYFTGYISQPYYSEYFIGEVKIPNHSAFFVQLDSYKNVKFVRFWPNIGKAKLEIVDNKIYMVAYCWPGNFEGFTVGEGILIARFEPNGTCELAQTVVNTEFRHITIDDEENIYISNIETECKLYKYSNKGILQWVRDLPHVYDIKGHGDGCYLTGYFLNGWDFNGTYLTGKGSSGVGKFLAKMNNAGVYEWAVSTDSTSGITIETDTEGNVYSAGFGLKGIPVGKFSPTGDYTFISFIPHNPNYSYEPNVIKIGSNAIYVSGRSNQQYSKGFIAKISNPGATTGLTEQKLSLSFLNIYPNPSSHLFNIDYTTKANSKELQLKITNLKGQTLIDESYNKFNGTFSKQYDLSKYAKGVYFVEIRCGDAVETRKIVLE